MAYALGEVRLCEDGRYRLTRDAAKARGELAGRVIAKGQISDVAGSAPAEPQPEPSAAVPPTQTTAADVPLSEPAAPVEPDAPPMAEAEPVAPPEPDAPPPVPPEAMPTAADAFGSPSLGGPSMVGLGAHLPDCHRCTAEKPPICPGCQKPVNPPLKPEEATGFAALWLTFVAGATTAASSTEAAKARGIPSVPFEPPTAEEVARAAGPVGLVVQRRMPAAAASMGDLAGLMAVTGECVQSRLNAAVAAAREQANGTT